MHAKIILCERVVMKGLGGNQNALVRVAHQARTVVTWQLASEVFPVSGSSE